MKLDEYAALRRGRSWAFKLQINICGHMSDQTLYLRQSLSEWVVLDHLCVLSDISRFLGCQ